MSCETSGFMKLTGCPQRALTSDVIELAEYSELYSKGLAPVAGGVLDQTSSFIQGHRQLIRDQQVIKRSLGII